MQRLSLVLTCALVSACVHQAPVTSAPAPAAATSAPPAAGAPQDSTPAPPAAETAAPAPAATPAQTPAPAAAPDVRTPTTPPPAKAAQAPAKPAGAPAAAKAAPAAAAAVAPAAAAAASAAPASPTPAALDLPRLEERLRDTRAIGVFTKLSLKNQVDDLLAKFRTYHKGTTPPTLPQLRQSYEVLLIKVISLLQDDDPKLAADVGSSREAIWSVLSDPKKFASLNA
jgi:hypothetical protein